MKYLFPLAFIALFFSCTGPSETEHEPVAIDTSTTNGVEDVNDIDKGKFVNSISVEDFLGLPFTLSVMSDEKWITEQKLHPNPHDKNIIDTLSTLSFRKSIIHVHNHDLIDGHIIDPEIKLVRDIKVGMQKDVFISSFSDLNNSEDQPFVEVNEDNIKLGCCAEQNDVWTFTFDNDTIVSIDYSSYLD